MKTYWHAILLAWVISFWSGFASAEVEPYEVQLPITCGSTDNLVEGLREYYKEEIVMMAGSKNAAGHELYHSLWINAGTGTWSFVVVNKNAGITCVIATGENVNMFFPGSGV